MVIESVAAAASSVLGGVVNNWERDEVLTHVFMDCRKNKAEQSFERQLHAIAFKIERQQLHREDIRDLIELTTARMDIYHLVGTLLLAFCIEWYTRNGILAAKLPIWYEDLFLISNFAAVGFLILSVWLSMYASIASRSIGTRLLTSFTRLSVPSRAAVSRIKVPIFASIEDFLRRRILRRRATVGGPATSAAQAADVAQPPHGQEVVEFEDDQQHLRRFLQELPRWLNYDTYSRVCMSYGMNQMLQALSYYVLGTIWVCSPLAATGSFIAIKSLSFIILWLDVNEHQEGWGEIVALALLHFGPPALASILLFSILFPWLLHFEATHTAGDIYKSRLSYCAALCYFGHAGWLWYLTATVGRAEKATSKFKASAFANVLEWVESKATRRDFIENLRLACAELQDMMAKTMQDEMVAGSVSPRTRQSHIIHSLCGEVLKTREVLANSGPHPASEAELQHAELVLVRFEVWARAPAIMAALEGLRSEEVLSRLAKSERSLVDKVYTDFLSLCRRLSLGICVEAPSALASGKRPSVVLPVAKGEECIVHMDVVVGGGLPVWVDVQTNAVSAEKPETRRHIVSFSATLHTDFARWKSDAESLAEKSRDAPSLNTQTGGAKLSEVNGGPTPGKWLNYPKSEVSAPPDDLPIHLVRYFIYGIVVWWCLAGCVHAGVVVTNEEGNLERLAEDTWNVRADGQHLLQTQWPTPARLFRVASLSCNDSRVWVSSDFSTYAAVQLPSLAQGVQTLTESTTVGRLEEVREGSTSTVICGDCACSILSPPSDGKPWLLAPLDGSGKATPVPVPSSWRLVAGTWVGRHASGSTQCGSAVLAGWDGASVFITTLRRGTSGDWSLHTRFAVDPALGLCPGGATGCRMTKPGSYNDLKALQVGSDGTALLVLIGGGIIDVWDLSEGVVRGRLHTGTNYTSMCHIGRSLLLSRPGSEGPVLAAVAAPTFLTELLKHELSSAVTAASGQLGDASNGHSFMHTSMGEGGDKRNWIRHRPQSEAPERASPKISRRQQHFLGTAFVQRAFVCTRSSAADSDEDSARDEEPLLQSV